MKITKFGRMWENDEGFIEFSDFKFEAENKYEMQEGATEETIIPEIIRYISRTCKVSVIDPPFDKQSELIVLHALRRARCDSKHVKQKKLTTRIRMAIDVLLNKEPTK